jgi:hypothetical protein
MKHLLLVGLLLAAVPSSAQVSPTVVAQDQVLSSMMRGHAERDRKAQLLGKRPAPKQLTPAEQRRAHQLEVEAAMRRPPAKRGSIR